MMNTRLHSLSSPLRQFAGNDSGISAVEFALILPLMITLYLGGVEVTQAVSVDRKVTLVAHTVGDLAAQSSQTIHDADMTNILNAASAVASPYSAANLKVRVSSITIDAQQNLTLAWSDNQNWSAPTASELATLPAALNVANTSLIWAEAQYSYTPTIGAVITGTLTLKDHIYLRPRILDPVPRAHP